MSGFAASGLWPTGNEANAAQAAQLKQLQQQIATLQALQTPNQNASLTPFTGASSGGVTGTLQPYINRQTQQASNALNGGLLNMQPQSMLSGNAGGQTIATQVPQQNSLLNFANRPWMQK